MSLISVIIPVYNTEKMLGKCVDSVLAQSLGDIDIVLVNDGSTDGSGAICKFYASKDSRVTVIDKENGGVSSARNAGVRWVRHNSDSQWITFVDSDDTIHPDMLALLYRAAVDQGADMSMCGVVEVHNVPDKFLDYDNLPVVTREVNESYIGELYFQNSYHYWTAWAKLLRLGMAESMPFEEGRVYEDNGVVYQWLCSARRIARVEQVMYYYYVNPAGISKNLRSSLDYLHALMRQIDYYRTINYQDLHKKLCIRYVADSAWIYFRFRKERLRSLKASLVRWNTLWFWICNKETICMEEKERARIVRLLFPACSDAAEKCHRLTYIFVKDGVVEAINHIVKKRRGGADEHS